MVSSYRASVGSGLNLVASGHRPGRRCLSCTRMEIPSYNLTFAYFTDPQGHLVGLSKGAAQ